MSRRRKASAGPTLPRDTGGGFSAEILVVAVLVASPALYRSLVQDLLPLEVALQRFVLIALGCWVLASIVQGMLPTRPGSSADAGGTSGNGAEATADAADAADAVDTADTGDTVNTAAGQG